MTEAAPGLQWGRTPERGPCTRRRRGRPPSPAAGGGSRLCPARACDRLGGWGSPLRTSSDSDVSLSPRPPGSGGASPHPVPPRDTGLESGLGEGLGATVTDPWAQTGGRRTRLRRDGRGRPVPRAAGDREGGRARPRGPFRASVRASLPRCLGRRRLSARLESTRVGPPTRFFSSKFSFVFFPRSFAFPWKVCGRRGPGCGSRGGCGRPLCPSCLKDARGVAEESPSLRPTASRPVTRPLVPGPQGVRPAASRPVTAAS